VKSPLVLTLTQAYAAISNPKREKQYLVPILEFKLVKQHYWPVEHKLHGGSRQCNARYKTSLGENMILGTVRAEGKMTKDDKMRIGDHLASSPEQ
jgi:hypothetical protein